MSFIHVKDQKDSLPMTSTHHTLGETGHGAFEETEGEVAGMGGGGDDATLPVL